MTATSSHSTPADSPTAVRERLEQQANAVRERLVSDIDELTDRSQRVEAAYHEVIDYAKRHKTPLIAAGVGIAALSVVAFFKFRAAAKRRERRRFFGHLAMQMAGVSPPPPPEPGFIRKSLAHVGSMAAAAAVNEVQQRLLRAVDGEGADSVRRPA